MIINLLNTIRATALPVVLSILLTACGDSAPIKIGFIGGLTARSSDISQASRNAVQLAIAEVNAKGGINGRMLELVVRDNNGDPATAQKNVQELAGEGVEAIIGPNLSSIAEAMLPAIIETNVVTISPTVSSLFFAGKDDPFFRMNSTTRQNAGAYAAYHYSKGGRRVTAAFDAQNRLFSESWLKEFQAAFEKLGGELINATSFDATSTTGYSGVVAPLLSSSPDAMLLVANGVDTAQLAQQIRKTGSKVKLMAAEWAASEELIQLGGRAIEGLTILQTYDRYSKEAHYTGFHDAYQKRFKKTPGYASLAAYDATTMLFAALQQRREGETLKQALLNLGPKKGLQQVLEFDDFGDSNRKQFFVSVKNGEFVVE
ncbi:MAG: ABC transporter substrate-binding protein [Rhodospirillales bacterium]|nr:ABC transporter substrate-binding protein [Rhodospirillales bacterium]